MLLLEDSQAVRKVIDSADALASLANKRFIPLWKELTTPTTDLFKYVMLKGGRAIEEKVIMGMAKAKKLVQIGSYNC